MTFVPDRFDLAAAARDAPTAPALVVDDVTYSYAALASRVAGVAASLDHRGVGAGARVAVCAANSLATVELIHALVASGRTLVPIHPRLTETERRALVAAADVGQYFDEASLPAPAGRGILPAASSPASAARVLAMLFTSGTSGRPKGALLSRGAFAASAAASAAVLGWQPHDRWLLCLPVCHIGGLSVLTRCLAARACVVLEPRFEPDRVLRSIARHGGTLVSVVPTMLRALLDADRANVLARARAVVVGGAACSVELREECARRGVAALTTYGLTEACSQVTLQRPRDPRAREAGSGEPLPGVRVAIVDDDGRALPPGQVGRIHVAGPTLMRGYDGAAPLGPEGLDTGDLGEFDAAGRLRVHARRSDLIVTGGENVYPVEVEQALERCTGVAQALVFALPDAHWGQQVVAALVPATAARFDAERVGAEVAAILAGFKRPRRYCIAATLPLLPSGKLDRRRAPGLFAAALQPWPGAPRAR